MSTSHEPAANEIVMHRTYDAPRERVFAAFTDRAQVDRWWGPNGFSTVTEHMDVRPGGEWRFVMRHADYGTFPNRVRYLEVVRPERLVYDHDAGVDGDPEGFRVHVTFEDRDGRTELTMRSVFATPEVCAKKKDFGAAEFGRQTLARLAEWLNG